MFLQRAPLTLLPARSGRNDRDTRFRRWNARSSNSVSRPPIAPKAILYGRRRSLADPEFGRPCLRLRARRGGSLGERWTKPCKTAFRIHHAASGNGLLLHAHRHSRWPLLCAWRRGNGLRAIPKVHNGLVSARGPYSAAICPAYHLMRSRAHPRGGDRAGRLWPPAPSGRGCGATASNVHDRQGRARDTGAFGSVAKSVDGGFL